jgi:hypothetical protein
VAVAPDGYGWGRFRIYCRRDKARTKPNGIISASVTIFTMSGASVRAPTSANGFIACQMASAGSLLNATKFSPG